MILKLHDGVIDITHNNTTEPANRVFVSYDYEIGTNHLVPLLIVNASDSYFGDNVKINLDLPNPEVSLTVYLVDKQDNIIRKYTSTYTCYKMCLLGTKDYINIFNEIERLQKENAILKEKGEVI